MKKRLLTFLLCAALMCASIPTAGAAFTDVSDDTVAIAAATLQGLGVVNGTSETTFSPDTTLTRAQVCTMVVNAMGLKSQVNTYARKTLFSDVSPSSWYNGYVNLAYAQGVINGYGNGTFGPDDTVTYGQLATILLRMLGYTTKEIGSVWPMDYTAYCEDLGLAGGLSLSPMDTVTRGQAAVLFYNAMKATVNGTSKPYYQTISGVSSTAEGILLDTSASYGGNSGLLMVYTTSGNSGETAYYPQANAQSSELTGSLGTILFDGSGRVVGFIPSGSGYRDLTISSATASALKDASGTSWRISSGAKVISGGEVYPYQTSGYLQLNAKAGRNVRLYYNDDGAISHLYVTGGSAASSEAAVAETASAASSLARQLGITGLDYTITKNGVEAAAESLAQYDVGYYDGASSTLRVSDYRVTGYISAASPSVTAASTLTVAGCSFEVLECAWDNLAGLKVGSKVTLLLTDDCKVAAVSTSTKLAADMVGVLAASGKAVTLVGSGVSLSPTELDYDQNAAGGLVTVTASSSTTLRCKGITTSSGKTLDIVRRTLGGVPLAPACAIYEWGGSGYVYDLTGNQGIADTDFAALSWMDSTSAVSYYHTNSAGQVDILLLKDVTGNIYQYGKVSVIIDGISLGSMDAASDAVTLKNASGTSEKYLCTFSASSGYAGIGLGKSAQGYTRVSRLQTLTGKSTGAEDFYLLGGTWYVEAGGSEFAVAENVQIHLSGADTWLSGEEGLTNVLADGYTLTVYYDSAAGEGGMIRLIKAAQ